MTVTRGQIVDYTVTATDAAVAAGHVGVDEIVPLIVVSAADDGSYAGCAFLPTGTTEYVSVPAPAPVATAPKYDSETGLPIGLEVTNDPAPKFDSETGLPIVPTTPVTPVSPTPPYVGPVPPVNPTSPYVTGPIPPTTTSTGVVL
jgi:hypothetical protein